MTVRRLSRRAALAASGTLLTALATVVLPGTAHAAYCDGHPDAVTWDGEAGDNQWATPLNWSNNQEPQDVYVCLSSADPVVMTFGDGVEAHLRGIDVAAGTTLRVGRGNKLYADGPDPSYVRSGATVLVEAGTLGGTGRIDLAGTLLWRATAQGGSTITSRDCGWSNTCESGVQSPGVLRVLDTGTVRIDRRGVNLHDQYRLVVHGTLHVLGREHPEGPDRTRSAMWRRQERYVEALT